MIFSPQIAVKLSYTFPSPPANQKGVNFSEKLKIILPGYKKHKQFFFDFCFFL